MVIGIATHMHPSIPYPIHMMQMCTQMGSDHSYVCHVTAAVRRQ